MKISNVLLLTISALAIYKIVNSYKYSVPEQSPPDGDGNTALTDSQNKLTDERMSQSAASINVADSVVSDSVADRVAVDRVAVNSTPIDNATICTQSDIDAIKNSAIDHIESIVQVRTSEESPKFHSLSKKTQDVLLRSFASDYTCPRMIDDDELYHLCVDASNRTGAPCGWMQNIVSETTDPCRLMFAADAMLDYFDNAESQDLSIARSDAIGIGRLIAG